MKKVLEVEESPNRRYYIRNANYASGMCKMKLETDGTQKIISSDWGRTQLWRKWNPHLEAYEREDVVEVMDATYVNITLEQHEISSTLDFLGGEENECG